MKLFTAFFASLIIISCTFASKPLDDFINNPLLQEANISLIVTDIKTGKVFYSYRPNNAVTPASTMKLVTAATALEILGPDFCFKTKLEIDGQISADSILDGNVYIRGGGDPTLGSAKLGDPNFMYKWLQALKDAGIAKINGSIVPDASIYDDEGVNPKWSWEDIGNYYAAGTYGICYLDNTYQLVLRSGKIKSTPEILRTIPTMPDLVLDNRLISTDITFDSAYFYGAPLSNNRTIRGEIPANKSEFIIKGDIPNPGALLALHFKEFLVKNGVPVNQPDTYKWYKSNLKKEIFVYNSPSLSQIVTEMNVHSNNLYTEHVFKYLSLKTSTTASNTGAINLIKSFWKMKGLPVQQLFMYDGCGLSPSDAISAQFLAEILTYMKTKSLNSKVFLASLPVAGESGTLSNFLKETSLQGKVRAKSGTISRVKCYAGYIDTKDKNYVFAVMVNNANGSSKAVTRKIEEFLLSVSNL